MILRVILIIVRATSGRAARSARAAALALSLPLSALAADADVDAVAPEHGKAATADASPVDRGAVEAELGYAPSFNDRGGAAGFDRAAPGYTHGLAGTLTAGVLPDVDVKLSAGFARVYDAAHQHEDGSAPRHGGGLTDAVVGARWRFLDVPAHALEVAVTSEVVFPVGAAHGPTRVGLTQGFWTARSAIVATKDVGAFTANAELAMTVPVSGDAGGYRSTTQVNLAAGYQLHPRLQPEVELNYSRVTSAGPDAHVLAVTAGLVAPLRSGRRVVAGVQHGVLGRNAPQTTSAVVAFKTAF